MDRRPRLRERASSRSSRRRIPALGCESLVRQDFPRYPRQSTFNGCIFKLLRSTVYLRDLSLVFIAFFIDTLKLHVYNFSHFSCLETKRFRLFSNCYKNQSVFLKYI